MVRRSRSPLPSRTVICLYWKSRSLTRRRTHSINRRPCSIQQGSHHQVYALNVCQYASDLFACENNWQALRMFSAFYVLNERQFNCQHLTVEKQQCAEGDVLCGSSDIPLDCQMGQIPADFIHSHFARVTLLVKED